MMKRTTTLLSGVFMVVTLWSQSASATEVFHGQVRNVGEGEITIEDRNGMISTFEVAESAKIMRDGKPAELKEIKSNDHAKLTTDNRMVATMIEARSSAMVAVPVTGAIVPASNELASTTMQLVDFRFRVRPQVYYHYPYGGYYYYGYPYYYSAPYPRYYHYHPYGGWYYYGW